MGLSAPTIELGTRTNMGHGIDGPRAGKAGRPQDEATKEFFKGLSLVTQIGLTMVIGIGLGFAAGLYVDRWLDTGHTFLIVGILVGIGAAFWNVYRLLLRGFVPPSAAGEGGETKDD